MVVLARHEVGGVPEDVLPKDDQGGQKLAKVNLVYADPKTPKICATCIHTAQVGDGAWICLKRTKVKDPEQGGQPYLVVVNLYANAAQCFYWQKGAELQQTEIPELSAEVNALQRRR